MPRLGRTKNHTPRKSYCIEALESRIFLDATYQVTSLADIPSSDLGYIGTLRWAIQQANADGAAGSGPDTVTFATGLSGTIYLTQGPLVISKGNDTVQGPEASVLTVDGQNKTIVFDVGEGSTATFSGLTIAHGFNELGDGAGINNGGALTVRGCTFANDAAYGGGGIFSEQASVSVTGCTFSDDVASGTSGGGIYGYAGGSVTITDCTFDSDSAGEGGAVGFRGITPADTLNVTGSSFTDNTATDGAAINVVQGPTTISNSSFAKDTAGETGGALDAGLGTTQITGCTFTDESATEGNGGAVVDGLSSLLMISGCSFSGDAAPIGTGGAIFNTGQLEVSDSTISGSSAVSGGGIYNSFGTVATITNCTLSVDSAAQGAGIYDYGSMSLFDSTVYGNSASNQGGGIFIHPTEEVSLYNTIVAANTDPAGADDISGSVDQTVPKGQGPSSNNLIGIGGAGGLVNAINGNIVGITIIDLNMSPLENYGGPTDTIALNSGNPAIGAGSTTWIPTGLTMDQRGFSRTVGDTVDIGAYEFQPTAPAFSSFSVNGGAAQRSMVDQVTLIFSEPVDLNNGVSIAQQVSGGSPVPMDFVANSPDGGTTWNLAFPAYTGGSLPDGAYDLTLATGQITSVSDGQPVSGGNQTLSFFRLFGDSDGNGIVNNADYFQFKKTYGQATGSANYNPLFDYDANGIVNNADYFQFKKRYGMQIVIAAETAPSPNAALLSSSDSSSNNKITSQILVR
jgi:hypothetical protein